MLDNTITLAVDTANTGVTTDKAFSRYEEFQNRSNYIGADHSIVNRQLLGFYRSLPKANGNSRGMAKSSLKFTEDVTVNGVDATTSITLPAIVEVSFSIPVGTTDAFQTELRQRVLAAIDDDTLMSKFMGTLEI